MESVVKQQRLADHGIHCSQEKYIYFSEALVIHPPSEHPLSLSRADSFEFESGKLIEVLITPEVILTDEALKALEFKDRSCYMGGEKQLKFYKTYTTRNCEIECISNHSLKACGCVPFDVIRGPHARICGVYDSDCVSDLKYDMKYSKVYEGSEACECFLPCDSITYNYEILETKLRDHESSNETLFVFKFKDSDFKSMRRLLQFTVIDLCSCIGGILGLFAGISLLSFFEVFYFVTLRTIMNVFMRGRASGRISSIH